MTWTATTWAKRETSRARNDPPYEESLADYAKRQPVAVNYVTEKGFCLVLCSGSGAFRARWHEWSALFMASRRYSWRSHPYITFG